MCFFALGKQLQMALNSVRPLIDGTMNTDFDEILGVNTLKGRSIEIKTISRYRRFTSSFLKTNFECS